jgi:hypothetical protein
VFKSSASTEKEGIGDSSASSSPNEDNNKQQAIVSDCSENMCTVSQQKRTVPPTQSYRHLRCSNDCQGDVSANTLSMKKPLYQSKITNIKTSTEFTSSTDDSSVSIDKVIMKYQEAKQIANFRKIENPSIHVSL